jgi:rod shape-determining protein MreD
VAAVVAAAVVFQVAVLDTVEVHGAHADVLVLVAVMFGAVAGPRNGAFVAFFVGLAADLFVDTPYGLSALGFVLAAYVVGNVAATVASSPSLVVGVAVAGSIAGTLIVAGLGALLGQPGMLRANIVATVIVVTVGNCIMAWPVAWAVRWSLAALSGRREGGPAAGAGGHQSGTAVAGGLAR